MIEAPIGGTSQGEVLGTLRPASGSRSPRSADLVLEALGKPASQQTHVEERPGQVDRHIGSTEKAERLLGWRARTSFADGLERTVEWYRENGGLVARHPRERSSRLLVLSAGPSQLGARGRTGSRHLDGGRRPRSGGAGLLARRQPLHRLDRRRARDRAACRRALARRRDRSRHRLAGRRRGARRRKARPAAPDLARDSGPRDQQAAPARAVRGGRRPAAQVAGRERRRGRAFRTRRCVVRAPDRQGSDRASRSSSTRGRPRGR